MWKSVAAVTLAFYSLPAQCDPAWALRTGWVGADDAVRAVVHWDPDGAGPQPEQLVVGGDFQNIGRVSARGLARFDAATSEWQPFPGGLSGNVSDMCVSPTGELVVSGSFVVSGASPACKVASWSGVAWNRFGTGFNGNVTCMEFLNNGDLVVGGVFNFVGSISSPAVARWSGGSWHAMSGGTFGFTADFAELPDGTLFAIIGTQLYRYSGSGWVVAATFLGSPQVLAVDSGGRLLVGGTFAQAPGNVPCSGIARFDGTAWTGFPLGSNSQVLGLLPIANGGFYMGGQFTYATAGGPEAVNVVKWNGSAWAPLQSGFPGTCRAFSMDSLGRVVLGGQNLSSGPPDVGIYRWDDAALTTLGIGDDTPDGGVIARVLANGDVVVIGEFTRVGNVPARRIARWNGTSWSALGTGLNSVALSMAELPNGNLVISGFFTEAGGVPCQYLAQWNGTSWAPVSPLSPNNVVNTVAVAANGDLVVGGYFTAVGALPASRIARWNGVAWSAMGAGFNDAVITIAAVPGSTDVVAGGRFTASGPTPMGGIARFTGGGWNSIGGSMAAGYYVDAIAFTSSGDLIAGGSFDSVGGVPAARVARWNGNTWQALGSGQPFTVEVLHVLENDDVLAVVTPPTASVPRLVRWNGSAWSAFVPLTGGDVGSLSRTLNGQILVTGHRLTDAEGPINYLGILAPTCPSSTTSYGTGCSGVSGPVTLASSQRAWLGATVRSVTSNAAPSLFAASIYGIGSASVPLLEQLPFAGTGCMLLVDYQAIELVFPIGPTVGTEFRVPRSSYFVGLVLHHQVAPVVLDANGGFAGVTSSNALTFTIGAF